MTRIKICGITSPEDAIAALKAGADMIGIVLTTGSPRSVNCGVATSIVATVDSCIPVVAVLKNYDPNADSSLSPDELPGDLIQLHGDETERIAGIFARPVIRGMHAIQANVDRWSTCSAVDYLLLDGRNPGSGEDAGHGSIDIAMPLECQPVILAGGLSASTVGKIIERHHPWGVDVSSGVESSPGRKDPAAMRAFCNAVREAPAC